MMKNEESPKNKIVQQEVQNNVFVFWGKVGPAGGDDPRVQHQSLVSSEGQKKKVVFFPFLGFNFSLLPWQDGPGWWHRSLSQSVTYSV